MPKLDLRNALRIKAVGGELAALKGAGFSWVRPPSEPPITIAGPMWSENFNAYADGTRLIAGDPTTNAGLINANPGNIGWTAVMRVGATANNSRFEHLVFQGRVRRRTANSLANGDYINVAPAGSPDSRAIIRAGLLPPGTAGTDRAAITTKVANWENRLRFHNQNRGALNFNQRSGGVDTAIVGIGTGTGARFIGGVAGGALKAFDLPDEQFTFVDYNDGTNDRIIVRRGKCAVPVGVPTGYIYTGSGYGTGIGVPNDGTTQGDGVDFIEVHNPGPVMFFNETHDLWKGRIFGLGGFANGAAEYTFTGTFQGTAPTRLQWALFDPESDALVRDWAWVPVAGTVIGSGTWSATVIVPWGLNSTKAYLPSIRPVDADGVAWTASNVGSTRPFAVTANYLAAGQSNSGFFVQSNLAGPAVPRAAGSYVYDSAITNVSARKVESNQYYSASAATTTVSNGTSEWARIMAEYLGGPVSMSTVGIGARRALDLGPNGDPTSWALIQTYFAAVGAFEGIYLSQGENDSTEALAPLWAQTWIDNFAVYKTFSQQPAGTTIPVFINYTGRIGSTFAGGQLLHEAQDQLVATMPDCYLAASYVGIGQPGGDNLHYLRESTDRGYWGVGRRLALTMRNVFSGTGYDGVGPRAQNPTRSGAVITVPYDLRGATGMVARNGTDGLLTANASALTGAWQVSSDNFATTLPINSVALVGNNVEITLASAPAGPVRVRNHAGGIGIDITSWPFGTYADGTFIASKPIFTSLLSN